ncbi:hypothetical protein KY348_00310 [Candidatus Woesearchaeota archaeon]|nr:hypothetical protein [Candidatus Woesearchaeota archaeon]
MDWKEFFKPNISKLIILVVFILIFMVYPAYKCSTQTCILDAQMLVGIPLGFYPVGSAMCWGGKCPEPLNFSWFNLVIDIIFWFIFACLLVAWYKHPQKWRILLLALMTSLIIFLLFYLGINLMSGKWGVSFNPIIILILVILIIGVYAYLINKSNFFGLRKK